MGKRIWLAAVFTLALPLLYSLSTVDRSKDAAPISVVALGGHANTTGVWCDCDFVDGVCTGPGGVNRITESPSNHVTKRHVPAKPARGSRGDVDFGPVGLWLGLGLLLWRYMRNSIF